MKHLPMLKNLTLVYVKKSNTSLCSKNVTLVYVKKFNTSLC